MKDFCSSICSSVAFLPNNAHVKDIFLNFSSRSQNFPPLINECAKKMVTIHGTQATVGNKTVKSQDLEETRVLSSELESETV